MPPAPPPSNDGGGIPPDIGVGGPSPVAAKAAAVLAESAELNPNELITEPAPVGLGGFVISNAATGTIVPMPGPTCVAGVLGASKELAGNGGGGLLGVACSCGVRQHGSKS